MAEDAVFEKILVNAKQMEVASELHYNFDNRLAINKTLFEKHVDLNDGDFHNLYLQ